MPASPDEPAAPGFQTDFLRILNNRSKENRSLGYQARTRGFVVVVRGGSSLKPLQDLCLDPDRQTFNHCLTARYRLQPSAGLATLVIAFLDDLARIRSGKKELKGELKSGFKLKDWKRFTEDYLKRPAVENIFAEQRLTGTQGVLKNEQLWRLLASFEDESSVLRTGDRLILFGELAGESPNTDEWKAAVQMLFTQLPERFGIVLSGAPKDFKLPADDPHFLELELPEAGSAAQDSSAEVVMTYAQTSFQSDQPAEKDELGVDGFARAFARFILHPQTAPPLTFGIYGAWGKGKSSFMKLIENDLIRNAEVNAGPQKGLKF